MKKLILLSSSLIIIAGLLFLTFLNSNGSEDIQTVNSTQGSYFALGDSVAAGVGLKDYVDSSACNRTKQAYPSLIAAKLNLKLSSRACTGATTGAGINGPQEINQLSVQAQIELLEAKKPDVITLTAGANDIDWTSLVRSCYTGECGSAEERTATSERLFTTEANIKAALSTIDQRYIDTKPDVFVTGYYSLFGSGVSDGCNEVSGITTTELQWINELQAKLNSVIENSVREYSFAEYVPLSFEGHELCSTDPWIQGFSDKTVFHPTAKGQVSISEQLSKRIGKKL